MALAVRDGNKRMTTYGKRKKGQSSPRAKFDEVALQEGLQMNDSVAPKKSKPVYGSRYFPFASRKSNDDSVDDLANEILDDTPPRMAQDPDEITSLPPKMSGLDPNALTKKDTREPSHDSSMRQSLVGPKHNKSFKASSPHTSPLKSKGKITKKQHQRGPSHSQKGGPDVFKALPKSPRVSQNPFVTDADPGPDSDLQSYQCFPDPDVDQLSERLTLLIPRDDEDVQTPARSLAPSTSPYKAVNPKPTPLQRSKDALKKVKRALSSRKGNGSEESGSGWRSRLQPSASRPIIGAPTGLVHVRQETGGKNDEEMLRRREAEGKNPTKDTIKILDENAPPEPLPIYESMRSKRLSSMSTEDLVSPEKAIGQNPRGHRYTKSAGDFNDLMNKKDPAQGPAGPPVLETSAEDTVTSSSTTEQDYRFASNITKVHRFSSSISGLRQHPDVMFFPSSPQDHSTPRVRLEERADVKGKTRLSTVPSFEQSSVDLPDDTQIHSKETRDVPINDSSIDDSADELGPDFVEHPETSLTLKRKSGSPDLRCASPTTPRKLRKVTSSSEASSKTALTSSLASLTTSESGALGAKDGNKKLKRSTVSASKRNGLHIFDIGKGKEKERVEDADEEEGAVGMSSKRGGKVWAGRKPPVSRYNRDWMASMSMLESPGDEDAMSLDELQSG